MGTENENENENPTVERLSEAYQSLELVPDVSSLVKQLVQEVTLEGVKDKIKTLAERRKRLQDRKREQEQALAETEALIGSLTKGLEKLMQGDLSVLDKSESYNCKSCRTTSYNQFEHEVCPNCGSVK